MMDSRSSAAIPRDVKQIANMRTAAVKTKERQDQGIPVHESVRDRLYSVLIMAVEEQSKEKEKYIHGVTAWPEGMCIVGFPYQFMIYRVFAQILFSFILLASTPLLISVNFM